MSKAVPQTVVEWRHSFCQKHLTPFRAEWPRGYGMAVVLLFSAFCRLPDVIRYCDLGDDGGADARRLQAALEEFGPICCALAPPLRRQIIAYALHPVTPPPSEIRDLLPPEAKL